MVVIVPVAGAAVLVVEWEVLQVCGVEFEFESAI